MNIKQAKKVDLIEFLEKLGYKEAKRRGKEHWYLSPIRTENTPSFKVNSETNEWYDYGMQEGGDIIDLCKHIYNVRSSHLRCVIYNMCPYLIRPCYHI